MPDVPRPSDLTDRVREGLGRTARRARHGLQHLAGTDPPAVGCTPAEVVWRRGKTRLLRYESDRRSLQPPVLLVMSLISKPYVLDLQPGNSFVEDLLAAGLDVYMLDWGVPDAAESSNTLETYVDELLPLAAAAVMRTSGTRELHVFGYCIGGMLAMLFAMAHPEVPLRSLSLLATPVDFSGLDGIAAFLRREVVEVDDVLDETGNVPPATVMRGLNVVNGVTGSLQAYANLLSNLHDERYVTAHEAMHGWAHDHIPFPGATFAQFVELFLRGNRLVANDVVTARGRLDVAAITCPVQHITGQRDRLVPAVASRPVMDLLPHADDVQFDAGHVGMLVGRSAHAVTIPAMVDWIVERSDAA